MNIHLLRIGNPRVYEEMEKLFLLSDPRLHTLCDDPEVADLILVVGEWDRTHRQMPTTLTRHPIVRKYADKCFAYTQVDRYSPLLPGVYTSASATLSARLKRVRNSCYIMRWQQEMNHYIAREDCPKKLLFSFMGTASSEVRSRLFKMKFTRPDVIVEDTTHYMHYETESPSAEQRAATQLRYARTLAESHFVLCPRGVGLGSLRFFETLEMGICPVLIADNYLLPYGPDWEKFLVSVSENQIDTLEQVLSPLEASSKHRGDLAYEAWRTWFAPQVAFNQIVNHCVEIRRDSSIKESYLRLLWPWMQFTFFVVYGSRKLQRLLREWTHR